MPSPADTVPLGINVSVGVKSAAIANAAREGQSLLTAVTVDLLKGYKPAGWQHLLKDVIAKSARRNKLPSVIPDRERNEISLRVPRVLRAAIEKKARQNFRSINAEVSRYLVKRYGV